MVSTKSSAFSSRPQRKGRLTFEEETRLRLLAELGYDRFEIAKKMGRSPHGIWHMCCCRNIKLTRAPDPRFGLKRSEYVPKKHRGV